MTSNARTLPLGFLLGVSAAFWAFSQVAWAQTPAEAVVDEGSPEPVVEVPSYRLESLPTEEVFDDFVLSPGKVELEIAPGESKTVNINVANRIGEERIFEVDIEDLGISADPERPVLLLGEDVGPYTLKDLISVPSTQFPVPHAQRAIVPVTISVPADADPGGRYGSVLVKTVTSEAVPGDANTAPSSAIVSRIGTLFFITVPGVVERSGELVDFSTTNGQTFFQSGPIDFNILYRNNGSIHLNPYGEIQITNMFGEEVGFEELDPWFAMPNSERLRTVSWNRDMLYGKYTAIIKLNRGYSDIVDEQSFTFWVIPWQPLALIFATLFIVFFLIRAFFRKFELKAKT